MPYFPKLEEDVYWCQGCGGRFQRGLISCCVAHPPGTCCHYGEERVQVAEIVHSGTEWPPEGR